MKKNIFMLLFLMGSVVACTESTDDRKTNEGLGPNQEAAPEGLGNGGAQDSTRNNVNNGDTEEDVVMPYGTGENI